MHNFINVHRCNLNLKNAQKHLNKCNLSFESAQKH